MNSEKGFKNNFNTYEEKKSAFKDSVDLYSIGLNYLSESLGCLHHQSTNKRYWEIILGLWLREISVIYLDRNIAKKGLTSNEKDSLKEFFKQICTIPTNYRDFTLSINTDSALSTILFSKIALNDDDFYRLPSFSSSIRKGIKSNNGIFFRKFIKSLINLVYKIFLAIRGHKINFLVIESLSKMDKVKIFFSTKGSTLPYFDSFSYGQNEEKKISLRKNLLIKLKANKDLENTDFLVFLIKSLPMSYLEDFEEIKKHKILETTKAPKIIFLDSRFRMDDEFKFLLAEWVSRGTKAIVLQHSMNCLSDFNTSYQNDITYNNYIYWDSLNEIKHTLPSLRVNKFVRDYKSVYKCPKSRESIKRLKNLRNDLYMCRALPNVQGSDLTLTLKDSNSIRSGRTELSKLGKAFERKILVKTRGDFFGGDRPKSDFLYSTNLTFSEPNQSLLHLYRNSRIIIFEGLSTGVSECIALNRPFLIFNNNSHINVKNSRYKDLVEGLKDLDILQDNVNGLHKMLSNQYIDDFYSSSFQADFLKLQLTYFPISEDYLEHWVEFFNESHN